MRMEQIWFIWWAFIWEKLLYKIYTEDIRFMKFRSLYIPNPSMRHIFILPCPWTCSLSMISYQLKYETSVVKNKETFWEIELTKEIHIEGKRAILHRVYHTRVAFAYTLSQSLVIDIRTRRFCDFQTFTISQKNFFFFSHSASASECDGKFLIILMRIEEF